jgi:cobaltochelatase CobN
LAAGLQKRGTGVIPVFTDANTLGFGELIDRYLRVNDTLAVDVLVNNILFLIKPQEDRSNAEESVLEFERLGVPVISPIQSFYISAKQWEETNLPINADMPSALISPEMAGMIEPVLIGVRNPETGKTDALRERAHYLARKIQNWISLRKKPNSDKKLAIVLHNSVCTGAEATVGKSFGLDAFESVVRLLTRLKEEGYHTGGFPLDGIELRQLIMGKRPFLTFAGLL